MMTICSEKNQWKTALQSQKSFSFLQSFEWGEFQKQVGNIPVRWLSSSETPIQGFLQSMGFGKQILYIPQADISTEDISHLQDAAKELGVVFLRIEPIENIKHSGRVAKNRQPQHSLVLDLSVSEEELLKNMHSKTRYNIRLAGRKGVAVRNEKNIDVFWDLNQATTARDGFTGHAKRYYQTMLEQDFAHQLTAYIEDTPIATLLLIHFGKTAVYLHGASANEHRNLMAPYLLQFEAMKLSKELGATQYDFWGVAASAQKEDPKAEFHGYAWKADDELTGVTRFKTGFGGEWKSYGQAIEIPVQKHWDRLYQLIKKFR